MRLSTVIDMTEQPHPDRVRLLPFPVPPLLFDVLLLLLILVAVVLRPGPEVEADQPIEWVAAAVSMVAVFTRRHWPLPTLIACLVTVSVVVGVTEEPTVLMPVTMIVLATVGVLRDIRTTIAAGLVTTVVFAVVVISAISRGTIDSAALASVAWPAFAAAIGAAIGASRENLANAEERARRAEATREIEAERRVVEERLRIARDVHDLVAHHLAVVNVQSGVAAHVLRNNPDAAETALGAVRESASTAVGELGQLLSVLRDPGSDEPVDPTPDLAAIDDLISSFAASGLAVENTTEGTPRPLSPSSQAAAYRMIQESLTNAHKHGDGRAVLVRRFDDEGLHVSVSNRVGDIPSETSTGFGLIGMRERVEAAGGELVVDDSGDRFEVRACLPVKDHT